MESSSKAATVSAYDLWKNTLMNNEQQACRGLTIRDSVTRKRRQPLHGTANQILHQPLDTCERQTCDVCGRFPFRCPNSFSKIINYNEELYSQSPDVFDILYRKNDGGLSDTQNERFRVEKEVAQQTADYAAIHARHVRSDMIERGLLQRPDQNFTGEASCARVVAPINSKEIQVGMLLGVGGFSAVSEINCFSFDDNVVSNEFERLSRQYLHQNVQRSATLQQPLPKSWSNKEKSKLAEPRYVLKHIKFTLANSPSRYQRAAIDLVMEAQLLLAIDHPNIVKLRGWPMYGTDAIRSGRLNDYFLVLDRLGETMEQRMWTWRKKLRQYQTRSSILFFQKQKFFRKLDTLQAERRDALQQISSAIEYIHNKRIIHRDLKSSNIGYDSRGDLKLFDFGLSRCLPYKSNSGDDGMYEAEYKMSRVGTRLYMAPEIRAKKAYGLPADVYSYGIVCWEIMSLSSPQDVCNKARGLIERRDEMINWTDLEFNPNSNHIDRGCQNIQACEYAAKQMSILLRVCPCWPLQIQDIIKSCLVTKPNDRPTMAEISQTLEYIKLESFKTQETTGAYTTNTGTCSSTCSGREELVRRRSTFRLDLSSVVSVDDSNRFLREVAAGDIMSCISQTSASSLDCCDFIGKESVDIK